MKHVFFVEMLCFDLISVEILTIRLHWAYLNREGVVDNVLPIIRIGWSKFSDFEVA